MDAGIKSTRALQAWTEYLQTKNTLEWLDDAGIVIETPEAMHPLRPTNAARSPKDDEKPQAA
jgi:hypothetical protein